MFARYIIRTRKLFNIEATNHTLGNIVPSLEKWKMSSIILLIFTGKAKESITELNSENLNQEDALEVMFIKCISGIWKIWKLC